MGCLLTDYVTAIYRCQGSSSNACLSNPCITKQAVVARPVWSDRPAERRSRWTMWCRHATASFSGGRPVGYLPLMAIVVIVVVTARGLLLAVATQRWRTVPCMKHTDTSHRRRLLNTSLGTNNELTMWRCLHSLLPPPRPTAVTSRLRSSQTFPKVHTHTQRYCSFIQYGLNHYQHKTNKS